MAEPWLRRRRRTTAYCPRCAKQYTRGRSGWATCLECAVNPKWSSVPAHEFVTKAKRVFPGSRELARPIDTAPSVREQQLSLDRGEAA